MPSRLLALIASVTLLIGLGVTAAPSYACACGGGIPLGPNGTVRAIAEGPGSTAYVGGDFTHWGLQTGGLASLSADEAAVAAQFPWVEGEVEAVLPDGTGGYFIGGLFTMVGGVERGNLAHIDAQAQVSDWAPRTDDAVYALALHGGDLYVGGAFVEFSDDGGQTWVHRSLIASVRATTGLLSSWAPDLTAVTPVTDYFIGDALAVRAIEVDVTAEVLYVGGSFQSVTTPVAPRNGAVAFDLAALASSSGLLTWAPNPDGPVYALLVRASTVLLGGHFSAVGDPLPGEARKSIAEVIAADELNEGQAEPLRSDVTFINDDLGWVYALAESGTDIVIGGEFDELGGVPRANLALISSSGVLDAWHPGPSHEVVSLLVEGAGLYVGGYFQTMGGVDHLGLAYFSLTSSAYSGTPDAWDAGLDDGVNAVVAAPSGVVVGGAFQVANGVAVDNLVKVDGYGNRDEYFSASLPDFTSVTALGLLGDSLLVAGFDLYGYTFAATAVDAATGANPMRFVQTDQFINDIGFTDGTVIFTGDFTTVISVDSAPNPVPRSYAFSLNMADFTLTEWRPAFAGPIADMEMTEEWLYVVGNGPQSGSYIGDTPFVARVWLVEGIVDNWGVDFSNHGVSVYGTALSVAEWNGALVVGGERLSSLGGSDDGASLVGIDPEEDVVLWRSEANGLNRATSLLSDPQGLYVGGSGIWSLPGQIPASRGVALLASPASLADWEMSMADVLDITRIGGHIFAGGEGEVLAGTIASSPRKYLAVVEAATVGLGGGTTGGGTTGGGTTSVGTAAGNGSVTAAEASNEASRDPGNDMPANAESRGTDRVTVVFRRGQSHLTAAAKRDLRAAVSNARGRAPSRTSITLRIPSTDRNGSFARLAGARGARTRTYLQQLSLSGPIRVEVTKRPGTTGSRTATVSIASSTNG